LSVKDRKNQPSKVETVRMDNHWLFLSKDNRKYLINAMFKIHKKFGGGLKQIAFTKSIPDMMERYAEKNHLDDFESLHDNDWLEILHFTNDKFIKEHYLKFKKMAKHTFEVEDSLGQAEVNVFQEHLAGKNGIMKRPDRLTAEDIKNLDVWEPIEHYTDNSKFRADNKFRVWQTSVHTRNYDRSNEGLVHGNSRVASRVVPQRGYDMSGIHKSVGRYDNLKHTEL
jgi:hypothetical protein